MLEIIICNPVGLHLEGWGMKITNSRLDWPAKRLRPAVWECLKRPVHTEIQKTNKQTKPLKIVSRKIINFAFISILLKIAV